jgi:hypothetical protein
VAAARNKFGGTAATLGTVPPSLIENVPPLAVRQIKSACQRYIKVKRPMASDLVASGIVLHVCFACTPNREGAARDDLKTDFKRFKMLSSMQARSSAMIAMLATRLRILPKNNSRQTRHESPYAKPWEIGATE